MAAVKITGATGEQVAKRAFWLAWQACGRPFGMGFIQDRPGATEEDVWKNARSDGDYSGVRQDGPGRASGDYVFGRMMKLHLTFVEDTVSCRDEAPRRDYQAWCGKYPTYLALVVAAVKDLGAEIAQ